MRNKKIFLIGSRSSALAKEQTKIVIEELRRVGISNIRTNYILSKGDKLSYKKFKELGGKGLFTNDLNELVLKNRIDIAVHSSKDIPADIHKELEISAYLKREDVRDVLITKDSSIKCIEDLPLGSTFGSCSPRRISYLRHYRPDIIIENLRGNIDTRMRKIYEGQVFSTILARAGLNRLKLSKFKLNLNDIPLSKILPSPGQGAIAIIQRKDNKTLREKIRLIDDPETRFSLDAERALIKEINGDCFTPIGAHTKIEKNILTIKTRLFSIDNSNFIDKTKSSNYKSAKVIGKNCAKEILSEINFKYSK